ncbi:MAG: hypothetical protein ACOY41_10220 [Pseudomonadota bacterium]
MKWISRAGFLVFLCGGVAGAAETPAAPGAGQAANTAKAAKAKAGAAEPAADTQADAAREALRDTAWRVSCEACDRREFSPYFMFLRADGQIGSNPGAPTAYNYVSYPGQWRVQGNELFIEWSRGEKQVYLLDSLPEDLLVGVNQDNQMQLMVRMAEIRPGPERGNEP